MNPFFAESLAAERLAQSKRAAARPTARYDRSRPPGSVTERQVRRRRSLRRSAGWALVRLGMRLALSGRSSVPAPN